MLSWGQQHSDTHTQAGDTSAHQTHPGLVLTWNHPDLPYEGPRCDRYTKPPCLQGTKV